MLRLLFLHGNPAHHVTVKQTWWRWRLEQAADSWLHPPPREVAGLETWWWASGLLLVTMSRNQQKGTGCPL